MKKPKNISIPNCEKLIKRYLSKVYICNLMDAVKRLKIAVNTRLLLKNKLEGIGWFTYESFKRIVKSHPEHKFYFLFDRKWDDEFIFAENVIPVLVPPQARHPILFYIWFEKSLPRILNKIKPDIFISPDAFNSLNSPYKNLLIVHDLNFEYHPEILPWMVRKYYLHYTPLFVRKANRIATVSEYSKQDIIKLYEVDAESVDVVYNGANENFRPLGEEEKHLVRKKYSGGDNYFIFIGAFNKRKNLGNLLKAFDLYKKQSGQKTKLLLVGTKMFSNDEIKQLYENTEYKKDVIFTGRLEPEELYKVLGAALALTYVSLFEGFGIPIVEAFYAEVPVITSNTTSMPEVAGDAALLVDPFDVEQIASALKKITEDVALRKKLVQKGRERRTYFSWDKTADRLWRAIEKTVFD